MSKFQRKQSIGDFNQAGHGEHWHCTGRRAYATRRRRMGRETGVKPEQYIQFKESGLAGRGGATALAAAMPSMAMRSRSVRLPQSG